MNLSASPNVPACSHVQSQAPKTQWLGLLRLARRFLSLGNPGGGVPLLLLQRSCGCCLHSLHWLAEVAVLALHAADQRWRHCQGGKTSPEVNFEMGSSHKAPWFQSGGHSCSQETLVCCFNIIFWSMFHEFARLSRHSCKIVWDTFCLWLVYVRGTWKGVMTFLVSVFLVSVPFLKS